MRTVHGKLEGDVRITDQLDLHGMIAGDVVVGAGGVLVLHGMCCRDLIVEPGAEVRLYGTVVRDVYNRGGDLSVFGTINGSLLREAGTTMVAPGAVIQGDTQ